MENNRFNKMGNTTFMNIKQCGYCGSKDIRTDAWASWDEERQEWVLDEIFDNAFCCTCEKECNIIDEEVFDNLQKQNQSLEAKILQTTNLLRELYLKHTGAGTPINLKIKNLLKEINE